MAYVNYARINAARGTGKSSAVTVTKLDIEHIPWAEMFRVYQAAAKEWEETALVAHQNAEDQRYNYIIEKKTLEWSSTHPEEGAYEGNIRDENPQAEYSPLPNRDTGRRRAGLKALMDFIEKLKLGDWSETVMPQIITKLGNMPFVKNSNGLISGKQFVLDNFKTEADRGLYVFLMIDTRSCYLKTQYKGPGRSFSALVPLILYAIRLVKGIPYTAWDPAEIKSVVNYDLAEAMLFTTDQWPTRDEILEGREQGLTVAQGKDAGKIRSPVSTFKLYGTKGTCFETMPHNVQVMLAQIWVAHPENRTKYMVLDPQNWDRVPPALIPVDVFDPKPSHAGQLEYSSDIPWM